MRIATRGSALALWQADHVADALAAQGHDRPELVIVSTSGDRDTTSPLHSIGGKGVFVKEVQAAVLDGRADIAVHSAKDLPAVTPDGLTIAAIPERGEVRDCLVGGRLDDLAHGAVVATGSVRRRAQLARLRPDLRFDELRGNIATRLAKAPEFDAIVMATAALERLGETPDVVDVLSTTQMIPQVGQGALAVECRADDGPTIEALRSIEHAESARRVHAERGFLDALGGDCSMPAACHAVLLGDDQLELHAFLATESLDDSRVVAATGPDGASMGAHLADELRRRLADPVDG